MLKRVMFIQDAPRPVDLFEADLPLQAELRRRLPPSLHAAMLPRWTQVGRDTAGVLSELGERAEASPPTLDHFDAWGRRIDRINTAPTWTDLKAYSATHGIVATGYEDGLGEHARIAQAGLLHLFSASSATFSCPLAMTDAATRVLLDHGAPELRDRLVPRLLSRDPSTFITSGQWMTERPGGSDVGGTETVAEVFGDHHKLHGWKWFTSATTSEMALTLARTNDAPRSRGLSCFAVEVKRVDGQLQGILVDGLKDKLGTKALPTAELTLEGVEAWQIGDDGRGVATIATMLNVTRFYNAVASASGMRRATALAKDYATRREAFGRPLVEHPLHARTLAELEADSAGALAMCMELAFLLGRVEHGVATEDEQRRLRGLVPIAKLTLGKQAVWVASEALECFGGAGYVESTGLPRLLRDAQVLPIWEGTTNVLSLDLLRAEGREGGLSAVLADLGTRARGDVANALDRLVSTLTALQKQGDRVALEREARVIAMTTGLIAEATYLAENPELSESAATLAGLRLPSSL
jgi:acyl-CoA dehydrogenase